MPAFSFIGAAYISMNDYTNGISYLEKSELSSGFNELKVRAKYDALRQALRDAGIRGYWQEQWNRAGEAEFCWRAEIQLHLGDTNAAFAYLNRSYETHEQGWSYDGPLNYLIFDSAWDGIRADPRFKELLDKVGFTKVNPRLRE